MGLRFQSTSKRARYPQYRGKPSVPIGIDLFGIRDAINNLTIVEEYLSSGAASVIAAIALHILASAQPRVPYDTGQLRESGTALVRFGGKYSKIVGKGKKDGTIEDKSTGLKLGKGVVSFVTAQVTYSRMGILHGKTADIAVWTHEDIYPYEARPKKPAATKPGTGPKYLESAYKENQREYMDWIKDRFSHNVLARDIKAAAKVISGKAKGKYVANRIRLSRRRMHEQARKRIRAMMGKPK